MYTIIATEHHYGQIVQTLPKEKVRAECERLRKLFSLAKKEEAYCQIEVVNTDTGEVREYWNNHNNELQF